MKQMDSDDEFGEENEKVFDKRRIRFWTIVD